MLIDDNAAIERSRKKAAEQASQLANRTQYTIETFVSNFDCLFNETFTYRMRKQVLVIALRLHR
jgi:hypothetical protein